jgi:hypothetical protein
MKSPRRGNWTVRWIAALVADIDEDGITDIAMARSDAPNVLYFGNKQVGSPTTNAGRPASKPALTVQFVRSRNTPREACPVGFRRNGEWKR